MNQKLTGLEKAALFGGQGMWTSRPVPRLGIESVFFADGPHGVRKQSGSGDHLGLHASEPATCFPTSATIANSWDTELATEIGAALGAEAAALDVDVLLGPGLNIKRSPLAGRNFEYFSEDPYLSGKLAAAYIRGIQSQGVAATPKHFAVNSQEQRRMASDSVVDERTLREIYLTGFEIAVREGEPKALMSSYNLVNGVYANENHHLLTEILREEWGFDGMVVTDWGGGNDVVAAAQAGGGLEMPAPGLDSARQLVDAMAAGELPESAMDARAAEVIGLAQYAAQRGQAAVVDFDAHHELARRAAEQSIVLLKNTGSVLPLGLGTRVALIGDMATTPRYQGAGSSVVNPTRLVSAAEAIGDSPLELVGIAQGYRRDRTPDAGLIAEAVALAERAEVAVVFIGLDELSESEGMDRTTIDLPANQVDLLAALATLGRPVVAVVSAGAVVDTSWEPSADAIVHSYLGGQAGAPAVFSVLTGAVNPSGRLAESYPLSLADTPAHPHFPASGRYALYREGPFVGYRYHQTAGVPVRYPFGFGLGYASFDYDDLVVDAAGAEISITNTSPVDGAEVVQLYVGLPDSQLVRPAQELKGFAKVWLAAGQTRRVRIDFDAYTWRHFDVASNQWQVEAGSWQVMVGANAADIRATASLQVDGITPQRVEGLENYRRGQIRAVDDTEFARLLGRPVPSEEPSRTVAVDDPLRNLANAKWAPARLVHKVLAGNIERAERSGAPDLNVLFIYNMPFRAIAKLSNGMVSMAMVDGIVDVVNGHPLRGLRAVISGFFSNRRDNRRTREFLDGTREAGR